MQRKFKFSTDILSRLNDWEKTSNATYTKIEIFQKVLTIGNFSGIIKKLRTINLPYKRFDTYPV